MPMTKAKPPANTQKTSEIALSTMPRTSSAVPTELGAKPICTHLSRRPVFQGRINIPAKPIAPSSRASNNKSATSEMSLIAST